MTLGFSHNLKIHFIGIGGIGMSGIAEVLIGLGYKVSGSDLSSSSVTDRLRELGAEIYFEHHSSNVENVQIVVYSSAIDEMNPEIIMARANKIPIVKRAEMLAELMRIKMGIAVAGSHGKTTTTSLLATIFHEQKLDPTHIIGGIVQNLGGHAKKGEGEYLIAEADESDGSFLYLNPVYSVITNIDNDHLDYYGTEEKLWDTFIQFINKVPFYGVVALNFHDKNIQKILPEVKRRYVLYGVANNLTEKCDLDYSADKITYDKNSTSFDFYSKGKKIDRFTTNLSGLHNVYNALAAISIAHATGQVSFEAIKTGLIRFRGVSRRLETLFKHNDFEIIDDYGHHPTEVKATIKTIKEIHQKPLIVIFEPHRFSRTKQLWSDFLHSFDLADEIYIAPIYAASEAAIKGVNSESFTKELRNFKPNSFCLENWDQLSRIFKDKYDQNVILLTMGAGLISKKTRQVLKELYNV